jgi:hypothetical protein
MPTNHYEKQDWFVTDWIKYTARRQVTGITFPALRY